MGCQGLFVCIASQRLNLVVVASPNGTAGPRRDGLRLCWARCGAARGRQLHEKKFGPHVGD